MKKEQFTAKVVMIYVNHGVLNRNASREPIWTTHKLRVRIIIQNVCNSRKNRIRCAGGVEIGDNTIFGNYVSLHSENHNFANVETPIRCQGVNRKGIVIGEDCWIGAKVTILDGTKIGNGCIVAAGAVVRGEIPEYSIIGGIPAKVIKMRK